MLVDRELLRLQSEDELEDKIRERRGLGEPVIRQILPEVKKEVTGPVVQNHTGQLCLPFTDEVLVNRPT